MLKKERVCREWVIDKLYFYFFIDIAVIPKLKHFDDFTLVRQSILKLDDALCKETLLANLLMYAPSQEDDLVTMQKYMDATTEECALLDIPEQFTIEVSFSHHPQIRW